MVADGNMASTVCFSSGTAVEPPVRNSVVICDGASCASANVADDGLGDAIDGVDNCGVEPCPRQWDGQPLMGEVDVQHRGRLRGQLDLGALDLRRPAHALAGACTMSIIRSTSSGRAAS